MSGFVNYKKGELDSHPQVIKFASCLHMVGGSLRILPASSTTNTGRHDIAEIMLKVAFNTKNQLICYGGWSRICVLGCHIFCLFLRFFYWIVVVFCFMNCVLQITTYSEWLIDWIYVQIVVLLITWPIFGEWPTDFYSEKMCTIIHIFNKNVSWHHEWTIQKYLAALGSQDIERRQAKQHT